MHLRFVIYLLLLPLASACALKEEADVVFPKSPGKLFVESYLSTGEPIQLSLLRSNSFQEDLSLQLVWRARAELMLPDTTISLQNIYFTDRERGKVVNYVSTYPMPFLQAGDSVRLRIISEDRKDTLLAATELVEALHIADWAVSGQQLVLQCAHGTSTSNRFYGVYLEYERGGETVRKSVFYDYSRVDGPSITFRLDVPPGERTYRVIVNRITPANYHFQRALQQASRSNVDPFEAPVLLPSNIRGGLGIFTYSTADSLELNF